MRVVRIGPVMGAGGEHPPRLHMPIHKPDVILPVEGSDDIRVRRIPGKVSDRAETAGLLTVHEEVVVEGGPQVGEFRVEHENRVGRELNARQTGGLPGRRHRPAMADAVGVIGPALQDAAAGVRPVPVIGVVCPVRDFPGIDSVGPDKCAGLRHDVPGPARKVVACPLERVLRGDKDAEILV